MRYDQDLRMTYFVARDLAVNARYRIELGETWEKFSDKPVAPDAILYVAPQCGGSGELAYIATNGDPVLLAFRESTTDEHFDLVDPVPAGCQWAVDLLRKEGLLDVQPCPDTYAVRFTRKNSWPCEITADTPPDEIETLRVFPSQTRFEDCRRRVYDLPCGHGTTITIPVEA